MYLENHLIIYLEPVSETAAAPWTGRRVTHVDNGCRAPTVVERQGNHKSIKTGWRWRRWINIKCTFPFHLHPHTVLSLWQARFWFYSTIRDRPNLRKPKDLIIMGTRTEGASSWRFWFDYYSSRPLSISIFEKYQDLYTKYFNISIYINSDFSSTSQGVIKNQYPPRNGSSSKLAIHCRKQNVYFVVSGERQMHIKHY